ncbi:MAG TPA: DUF2306 domain-containing protein [Pseudonocardiaceae bacterium]
MTAGQRVLGRSKLRTVGITAAVLILIILVFAGIRVVEDLPPIVAGTLPDDDYAVRYVQHHVLAYLHIMFGVVYLLGAPLQLSYRFRSRNYPRHRRLGLLLLSAGLLAGVFALVFGLPYSFGGIGQASATAVFGLWFLACLLLAFRAIKSGKVVAHRRWMIRAFAMGLGVGTIRIWIGLFQATGLLDLRDSFAVAFWIAFSMHALAGEVWLRTTPHPPG